MEITCAGIDIAKKVFQVHGCGRSGRPVVRAVGPNQSLRGRSRTSLCCVEFVHPARRAPNDKGSRRGGFFILGVLDEDGSCCFDQTFRAAPAEPNSAETLLQCMPFGPAPGPTCGADNCDKNC